MRPLSIVLFLAGMVYSACLSGQCPDKQVLWARIVFLRDAGTDPGTQLNELLSYKPGMDSCALRNDSVHAFLYQRIGVMYYKKNDFLQAIDYTKAAIRMLRLHSTGGQPHTKQIITCYSNLGYYYDSLKLPDKKNEVTDSCIFIAIRAKAVDPVMLNALEQRVKYLLDIGDYLNCINYATMGESLAGEFGYGNADVMKIIFSWKVNAMLLLQDYEQAGRLLKGKIEEYRLGGRDHFSGNTFSLMAKYYLGTGRSSEALDYYKRSFRENRSIRFNEGCTSALNSIGYVYFERQHDYRQALRYYRLALAYADPKEALSILDNIANIYVERGNFDSAFYFFRKAFDQLRQGIGEQELLSLPAADFSGNLTEYLVNLVLDEANAFLKQYRSTGSAAAIRQSIQVCMIADRLFDKIRLEQAEIKSRLFWRTILRRLYETGISACLAIHDPGHAFYFFEKSRAVILSDQLKEQDLMSEHEVLQLAQLKKRILQLENESREADTSSATYGDLQKALFISRHEQAILEQRIRNLNPIYHQQVTDTNFISLATVRDRLANEHQTLLELFSGDSAVYCLLVSGRQTDLYPIAKKDFDSLLDSYTGYLAGPETINADYSGFIAAASRLYQLIFRHTILPGGRIVVSTDGRYFPFEALVSSQGNESLNYFITDHAVSYTYSARFLMEPFPLQATAMEKNFMGVAPVNYPDHFSLTSLAGSDRSLQIISRYFGDALTMVSGAATRRNFLQQFFKYKILQLYTHAADSSRHNEPVIYFADSALYLSDLIGENKPLTRLVVLSACETGLGKEYKGEGVFSFNRGFAALGIPSSVTNLWTVDNESTYRITELFYKYIAGGLELDEALQKAKLDFIKTASRQRQLPYYWAAAVLVGHTGRIPVAQGITWLYYVAAIGLPVFFFAGFMLLKKRRGVNLIPGKAGTAA